LTQNSAFDTKRILLLRLFIINEERTKYVSVCFYHARDYLLLVEFRDVRRGGEPKNLILSHEKVDAMAERFPMLWDTMCSGEKMMGVAVAKEVHFG